MLQEVSVAPMLICVEPCWRLVLSSTLENGRNHGDLNISKSIIRPTNVKFSACARQEGLFKRNAGTCCFRNAKLRRKRKACAEHKRSRHQNNGTSKSSHNCGVSVLVFSLYYCRLYNRDAISVVNVQSSESRNTSTSQWVSQIASSSPIDLFIAVPPLVFFFFVGRLLPPLGL